MKKRMIFALCALAAVLSPVWAKDEAADKRVLPAFDELYRLVRSNATAVSQTELNNAAVVGLLEQLRGAIQLITNAPANIESKTVLKTAIFDEAFGYIRIGRVESGLPEQVQNAHAEFQSTNKLKGLVLDLRFAGGHNYPEAAAAADLFLTSEQPLLELGPDQVRSKDKAEAITTPAAVLVNQGTTGAAEALAALMRTAAGAIVIGQTTAGEARVFKEFTLSTGQKVRLATDMIRLGDGSELPPNGLTPDIRVPISPEEEQAFLDDPFRARGTAQPPRVATAGDGGIAPIQTNGLRRPRNESELIRMRREGIDLESELAPGGPQGPIEPVLTDPALARAVDFLKGLAVVQRRAGGGRSQ